MDDWSKLLSDRERYSLGRISKFKDQVEAIAEEVDVSDICVYVTGSYGRREASEFSDLDLFFIHLGKESICPISNVDKALIDSCLVRSARKLKFPEFSRGGEYLNIHYLDDVLSNLGNRVDDYKNYFTARLLLILEGSPILNAKVYDFSVDKIIDSYYRDYHDHEKDFLPIFLVNDILRFWRTLCLNYEHNRNRDKIDVSEEDILKNHLKNFKLKFSRLLICYSMIAAILHKGGAVTPEEIKGLVGLTPSERLKVVASKDASAAKAVDAILADYAWFMKFTAYPEATVLEWIADRANRNEAFERARAFGTKMNALIVE
ncbi:MAG: hypothetical protein RLN96_04580, partial [Pseudomonadales bacterium]